MSFFDVAFYHLGNALIISLLYSVPTHLQKNVMRETQCFVSFKAVPLRPFIVHKYCYRHATDLECLYLLALVGDDFHRVFLSGLQLVERLPSAFSLLREEAGRPSGIPPNSTVQYVPIW